MQSAHNGYYKGSTPFGLNKNGPILNSSVVLA